MGFETWLTSYRERKELMAFMKKVGAKIVNRGMAMGWAAWASMYWERREQLEFLQKAAARIAMQGSSMMFGCWREVCADARSEMQMLRKAGSSDIDARAVDGISVVAYIGGGTDGADGDYEEGWCETGDAWSVDGMGVSVGAV